MTAWVVQVPLGDVFQAEPEMDFRLARETVVGRLRAALLDDALIRRVLTRNQANLARLDSLLLDLSDTEDADYFDYETQKVYDWCDDNRVWLDAFASPEVVKS